MNPDELRKMCESIFSYAPKEKQLQTINSYYGGKDTIFVAPTGYGKSLIYQMAPFLYDKRYESCIKPHNTTAATFFSSVTTDCSLVSDSDFNTSSTLDSTITTNTIAENVEDSPNDSSTPVRPMRAAASLSATENQHQLADSFSSLVLTDSTAKPTTAQASNSQVLNLNVLWHTA